MWVTRASARGGREQRRGPTGAAKGPNVAKGHVLRGKPEASWLRVYPILRHRMGKNKGRAWGVARTKLRSAQLCKLYISASPIFPKLTDRCSVCNKGWALRYSPNGQALKTLAMGPPEKYALARLNRAREAAVSP